MPTISFYHRKQRLTALNRLVRTDGPTFVLVYSRRRATPLAHHTEMRLPPILPYSAIDYYEQLVQVKSTVLVEGIRVEVDGIAPAMPGGTE